VQQLFGDQGRGDVLSGVGGEQLGERGAALDFGEPFSAT